MQNYVNGLEIMQNKCINELNLKLKVCAFKQNELKIIVMSASKHAMIKFYSTESRQSKKYMYMVLKIQEIV